MDWSDVDWNKIDGLERGVCPACYVALPKEDLVKPPNTVCFCVVCELEFVLVEEQLRREGEELQ